MTAEAELRIDEQVSVEDRETLLSGSERYPAGTREYYMCKRLPRG